MLWTETLALQLAPSVDLKPGRLKWRGSYTDKGDKTLFQEPEIRGLQRGPLDVGKLKKPRVCAHLHAFIYMWVYRCRASVTEDSL